VPRIHNRPERILLKGEITSPINPKPVCRFMNRCNYYSPRRCSTEEPALVEVEPNHFVSCHMVHENYKVCGCGIKDERSI